jgi:hypothetical protein
MTRKFETEQPADLTLTLFLEALDGGLAGEEEGYELTEENPRQYTYTLTEPTMFGLYRAVIKIVGSETLTIDSGYVRFGAESGTYQMVNKVPDPIVAPPVGPDEYTQYGPRRVKTKEMEIEQFSPDIIQKVNSRAAAKIPTFCALPSCVGRHRCEE